jgi:hypothetical protein
VLFVVFSESHDGGGDSDGSSEGGEGRSAGPHVGPLSVHDGSEQREEGVRVGHVDEADERVGGVALGGVEPGGSISLGVHGDLVLLAHPKGRGVCVDLTVGGAEVVHTGGGESGQTSSDGSVELETVRVRGRGVHDISVEISVGEGIHLDSLVGGWVVVDGRVCDGGGALVGPVEVAVSSVTVESVSEADTVSACVPSVLVGKQIIAGVCSSGSGKTRKLLVEGEAVIAV